MSHHPIIPQAAQLFEPVEDGYGTRLALVFGNEAAGGRCPFYGRQCYHCDIGAGEGVRFDTAMNTERLAYYRSHYVSVLPRTTHLVLYNSGSVLNPRELAPSSLQSILGYAATLAQCRVVSLDSREAYITAARLDFVLANLRSDQQARPILGLETQDDGVRLNLLNKRILRVNVEAAFHAASQYRSRVGMDVNIVCGLPPFRGRAAIAESEATASYALELAARYKISVDLNLHPYYPSRIGRQHFPEHPRANLDDALEAAGRIRRAVEAAGVDSKVFIGWQDEDHDQQREMRGAELNEYRPQLERFNTQTR